MLHVVTSNQINQRSIHQYHENFMIVDTTEKQIIPMNENYTKSVYTIYHAGGMDLSDYDEYQDGPELEFKFIPTPTITSALDSILANIVDEIVKERASNDNDSQSEIMLALACEYKLNRQMVNYINQKTQDDRIDIQALDVYRYLRMPSREALCDFLRTTLQTEFIYHDEPMSFALGLRNVIGGLSR